MSDERPPHLRDVFPRGGWGLLQTADCVELMQLQPERAAAADLFHGFPVLARLAVIEAGRRTALLSGLAMAIERGAITARCFIPHHGVRAMRGDRAVELIVCFACSRVLVSDPEDGGQPRETPIGGGPRQFIDWLFLEAGYRLHDLDDVRCEYCFRPMMVDVEAANATAPPIFDRLPPPTNSVIVVAVTRRCRRCGATDVVCRPADLDAPVCPPRGQT